MYALRSHEMGVFDNDTHIRLHHKLARERYAADLSLQLTACTPDMEMAPTRARRRVAGGTVARRRRPRSRRPIRVFASTSTILPSGCTPCCRRPRPRRDAAGRGSARTSPPRRAGHAGARRPKRRNAETLCATRRRRRRFRKTSVDIAPESAARRAPPRRRAAGSCTGCQACPSRRRPSPTRRRARRRRKNATSSEKEPRRRAKQSPRGPRRRERRQRSRRRRGDGVGDAPYFAVQESAPVPPTYSSYSSPRASTYAAASPSRRHQTSACSRPDRRVGEPAQQLPPAREEAAARDDFGEASMGPRA